MRKRLVIAAVILLVLLFIWREEKGWRSFDWSTLYQQARHVNLMLVALGAGLIYAGYLLRSLRWKLLLRPMCQTSVRRVLGPTLIGFTALALLGRPGELVRPYLLARRERLSVSSQLGIWAVERFFDVAAFATLFTISFLVSPDIRRLPYFGEVHRAFLILVIVGVVLALVVAIMYRYRERLGASPGKFLPPGLGRFSTFPSRAMHSFTGALESVKGIHELAEVAGVSLLMWVVIACAYWSVIRSFLALHQMTFPYIVLLMAFSMVGSLVQLPGGGSGQLVTIAVLLKVFGVPGEVAVGCGILLWLSTSLAPVPTGLVLLNLYGLSLRRVSHDSQEQPETGSTPDYTRTRSEAAVGTDERTGF